MKPKRRSQLKDQNINSKLLGSDINNSNIEKYREQALSRKQKFNLNGKLSSDILKTLSNKFSPEIIFSLNIAGQVIASIECLADCQNLMVLNISNNRIESLQPLVKMRGLWILHAGKNAISTLDPLGGLQNLVNLRVQGNDIKSLIQSTNNIKCLLQCPALQNLSLQGVSCVETNPICGSSGYRKNTLAMLQKIRRLDGVPRGMQLDSGKDLASGNKKDVKMELKNTGSFYCSKFPSVVSNYQQAPGQSELKKSVQSCKADLASLQRLLKLALAK